MTSALPYRDDSRTPLAFILSALLHILLAMGVVGLFLFKPAPPPQPAIFELVAAPSPDATSNDQPAPGPPSLQLPVVASPPSQTPPQPAEVTPTPPAPTPAVTNPPPKPALTHAPTIATKTTTPKSPMSYEQYLKTNNLLAKPAAPQATGRPVPTVGVSVSTIVKDLQKAGSGANGQARGRAGGAASSSDEQNYIDKLRERLKEAFNPPGGLTGLSAEVYLVIGPDGRLITKHLSRSSNNAEFDAAVNDALRSLTNVDPPPGGEQVSYKFTYTPAGV